MKKNLIGLFMAMVLVAVPNAGRADAPPEEEAAHAWRNVLYEPSHYDGEMRAIDAMVDRGEVDPWVHHVRALISRFDAVSHYKAEDNMELLVRAIGEETYSGYPAVDVLTRSWQVEEERRRHFADWAKGLSDWAEGGSTDQKLVLNGRTISLGQVLGKSTPEKAWLAASLSKTLRAFVETPAERVDRLESETFVRAVYRSALGRNPSGDDLAFRLRELETGKSRDELIAEVYSSEEAESRRMYQILERAQDGE